MPGREDSFSCQRKKRFELVVMHVESNLKCLQSWEDFWIPNDPILSFQGRLLGCKTSVTERIYAIIYYVQVLTPRAAQLSIITDFSVGNFSAINVNNFSLQADIGAQQECNATLIH